jgi:hypothetical protein
MASKWFIAAPGIRDRKHAIRKHGAQFDRYFSCAIRSLAGKSRSRSDGHSKAGR